MTIFLLLIFGILLIFDVIFRLNRKTRLINKIPGPPTLPIFGNLLHVYGNAEHVWNTLTTISDQYPITRLWYPTVAVVFIRDPDDLEILLTSKVHIVKGSIYVLVRSWLQDGIVLTTGKKWEHHRKLASPAFHLDNLKKNVNVSNKYGNKLIKYIISHGDKSIHNLVPLSTDTFLRMSCEGLLDVDIDTLKPGTVTKFTEAVSGVFKIGAYRIVRPYIKDWMMPFLPVGRKEKRLVKDGHNLRDEIIKERKNYHDRTGNKLFEENTANRVRFSLIDQYLISQKKGLIDQQGLEEDLDNFMVAGHDTTAVSMIYILMLLAENKKAQDLARLEANKILNQTHGEVTVMDEVQKFDYIERCIKEALRLYPSVPFFMRNIKEDIQLKNYLIPAGHEIVCMVFNTHKDPKYWPDPNKFDPDRFLPKNMSSRHPYAYLPFSAGPRNCIGRKLAMIQLKITIAKILYNFYLEPVDITSNLKFSLHGTLHPTNPIQKIKFIKILNSR